jgi:hypothetical protein
MRGRDVEGEIEARLIETGHPCIPRYLALLAIGNGLE